MTEKIRKALTDGNIGCGVFVDLQKVFDTVVHQILLAKLYHYEIRGDSNDWFKSYLSNCNQYVSINGYESGLAAINCGIPQGLEPLLFLLYMFLRLTFKSYFVKLVFVIDSSKLYFVDQTFAIYDWKNFCP